LKKSISFLATFALLNGSKNGNKRRGERTFSEEPAKEVVKPRQVIMYILREDFNTSYPYIGQKLGGRDHTTVIHAYEKIKKDVASNQPLQQEIEQIRNLIYHG
jgi:chromosomal replication initiator protein